MRKTFFPTLAALIRQAYADDDRMGMSTVARRHGARAPLAAVAALAGILASAPAHAIGLGELQVQSGLGQALRASIGVLGSDAAARPVSCYSARLSSADGAFIVSPRLALVGGARLTVATSIALAEPALSLMVEIACGDAVRKEFTLLLDPPLTSLAPLVPEQPSRTGRMPAPALRRPSPAAEGASADTTLSDNAAAVATPIPTADSEAQSLPPRLQPAAPRRAPRPTARALPGSHAAAAATTSPAPETLPVDSAATVKSVRSVLRMSTRASAADTDLINAIGLRLALADRLSESRSPTSAAGNATDAATQAADRAARARFLEALNGDGSGDAAAAARSNEQRLQQLQAKTRVLEKEAARLRQVAQQDAAARKSGLVSGSDNLLLAGLVALLIASLAAIAWLTRRIRHLQRRDINWNWEENVSAADARASSNASGAAGEFEAEPSLEEEARAESAARAALAIRAEAEARERRRARAEAEARHSLNDAFWEAAVPPVPVTVASPPAKAAPVRIMKAATVSSELSELAVLANTSAAASSSIAMPTVPMMLVVPTLPVAVAPMMAPADASAPDTALEITQRHEVMPVPLLPELEFPGNSSALKPQAAVLRVEPGTTATPSALSASAKAVGVPDLQFAEIRMQSTSVEEISDVMQEAEFWLSLHDLERAAEVLEPYATYEQPGSPLPWLYLFELYRDLGWSEKYSNLRDRFQRIFNARALTWEEQKLVLPGVPQRGLEDVPHVALKVTTLWQSEEVLPYLESLLVDDRDGTRAGFDLPVYKEIMFLILLAYELQQARQYLKPAIGTPQPAIPA